MSRKILTTPRALCYALVIHGKGVVMSKDGHLAVYDTHAEAKRHQREGQDILPFTLTRDTQ